MKKNYWLDVLLFVTGLTCIVTGLVLDFHWFAGGRTTKMFLMDIHIYTGYAMSIGLLFHLAWHMGWIKNVTKMIWGQDKTSQKKA